jgi:hypothetical protein
LQLGFNARQQLVHMETSMRPYGIFRLRQIGWELRLGF